MKRNMILILSVGLLIAADAKEDAKNIQGEWKVESAVENGKPSTNLEGTVFTHTAEKIAIKEPAAKKGETASYTLDSTQKPGHIDITPIQSTKILKGIFELDGDTLKICFTHGGERPKEFASKEGSKTVLLTLKRQQK